MSAVLAQVSDPPGFSAPLDEHEVLVLLVQLVLLVGTARLLGGLMKLAGQPAVVGELAAGVLLGPSVFARVAPGAYDWVFGEAVVGSVVFGLAWVGVIMLLIVIGYETDLGIINRFRAAALAVSIGAFVIPMVVMVSVAFTVPDSFVGEGVDRRVFAGFFALALSVSALPVMAKILQDLGLLRRNFGQITLAAGMTMDAVGWLLLAALSGIAQDGFDPVSLAVSFGGLLGFLLLLVTVGRWVLDGLMRVVLDLGSSTAAALTIILVSALAGGMITQALRLEAILGAFAVGILLATLRHRVPQVETTLETVTASFFAPIFFAFSGLRVDVGLLGSIENVGWAAGLVVLAVAAKVGGTMLSARLAAIRGREAFALGSGLSSLGAMGIVVAIVALNLGVVSETGYTVAVLAAIVTSLLSPQLLKLAVRNAEVPPEERARLDREELVAGSEILSSRRILLPTRGGWNSRYAARVIASTFDDPDVTVLSVSVPARRWPWSRGVTGADPSEVVEELAGVRHRVVRRRARDPAAAIAREARLGYDLILLGASDDERESPGGLFSTVVDRVLSRVDIPTVVVRFPRGGDGDIPLPSRVLVPVAASRSTRAAEELAYSLVRRSRGTAVALHVVNQPEGQGLMREDPAITLGLRAGQELVGTAAAFGERLGVVVETRVAVAANPAAAIVEEANRDGFDLVVIGASNRPLSDRPFFGHRVSYIIERSRVPLAIVTLPRR